MSTNIQIPENAIACAERHNAINGGKITITQRPIVPNAPYPNNGFDSAIIHFDNVPITVILNILEIFDREWSHDGFTVSVSAHEFTGCKAIDMEQPSPGYIVVTRGPSPK